MRTPVPQMLRSDAEDNRERILNSARKLFAERGLSVTMRDVARHAGVGPATLYRRFPSREDLIQVAFRDELATCEQIVAEGCADSDAWRGLRSVVQRIGEQAARNRGFTDAFLARYPEAVDFTAHRSGMLAALTKLCRRAQASGKLRADFTTDDLVVILLAGRALADITPRRRVAAARRFSALLIEGLAS